MVLSDMKFFRVLLASRVRDSGWVIAEAELDPIRSHEVLKAREIFGDDSAMSHQMNLLIHGTVW